MRNLNDYPQLQRTLVLMDMVVDKLKEYYANREDCREWKEKNPDQYWYPKKFKTNPTEVKRLMLVLRQEMIKLEKML